MLLITCPHCGPRAQVEFTYGGDATVTRPADPAAVSDEAWHDYLMLRDNPKGWLQELWHHSSGCRTWFKVLRNTQTHRMAGSATLDQALPEPPAPTQPGPTQSAPTQPASSGPGEAGR